MYINLFKSKEKTRIDRKEKSENYQSVLSEIIKDIDSKPYEVNVQPRLLVIDDYRNCWICR